MAYITVSATNISKPISTNSPSVSTGGCIRLTPSAPYSALRATSPHRLTQNSTREIGDTPHVVAVGDNRIGMVHPCAENLPADILRCVRGQEHRQWRVLIRCHALQLFHHQ